MNECEDCTFRGYSRELCTVHLRRCRRHLGKGQGSRLAHVGSRTLGGLALGITAGLLVASAASFVGGGAVLAALLSKCVAGGGVLGSGVGLARGLVGSRPPRCAGGAAAARAGAPHGTIRSRRRLGSGRYRRRRLQVFLGRSD